MKNIDCIPYSDVAAAKAVVSVCAEKDILWELICLLIKDPPSVEQNSKNNVFGLYFSDIGHIKLSGKLGGTLTSNYNPWLLLSNLSILPMASEDGKRNIQLKIFKVIGSSSYILVKPEDMPFKNMAGFHTHDIKGGECICGKTGIIEPITYAMQCSFDNMPQEMLRLCREAIEKDMFFLAFRLDVAAYSLCTIADAAVSKSARKAHDLLKKYIDDSIKKELICDL